ncbi:hypothetical protein PBV87_08180 [Niameybacter massiliensis]|uniref:CRISPR-associated exonuclease Cas4 n=1 Tax=Holtiella tumoricola TaxID=3018743 RepID=A0AA42DM74_9FIRM|nr:Dna2/Cas4 domain-containing protein [Holtiella tumoricola]MDA3731453.1 hypothetical protein [Holtiella tumoricola]
MEIGEALLLGACGLFLCYYLFRPSISCKQKMQVGLPFARMIYTDENGGKMLVSEEYDLQGKPDYIFKTFLTGRYIPFEIKSGVAKEDLPHEGDMMQLLAYFLLVEAVYGKKPPYGKLVYSNKTFKIRNTYKHRLMVKNTLRDMHLMLEGKYKTNETKSYIKCRNCICQYTVCECEEED